MKKISRMNPRTSLLFFQSLQGRLMRALRPLSTTSSLLCIALLIAAPNCAFTQGTASATAPVRTEKDDSDAVLVIVDGKLVNAEAVEIRRATQVMVWLRDLERLGWGTIETGTGDEIRFRGKSATLQFQKNGGVARVNSLAVRLPIDTFLRGGKLMVPLSFVAKALGFEYETSTRTVASIRTAQPRTNSISGRVIYNGRGEPGILIRAVDASYTALKNVTAVSDGEGRFTLSPLPDGRFMAYVHTSDNPGYFLRASEPVDLNGGQNFEVKPITLARVIVPDTPKPGNKVSLSKPQIDFAWSECPGAAEYRLRITSSGKTVVDVTVRKPAASVASSRLNTAEDYSAQVTALNQAGELLGGTATSGGRPWTFSTVK